jgi:hypothetical protein
MLSWHLWPPMRPGTASVGAPPHNNAYVAARVTRRPSPDRLVQCGGRGVVGQCSGRGRIWGTVIVGMWSRMKVAGGYRRDGRTGDPGTRSAMMSWEPGLTPDVGVSAASARGAVRGAKWWMTDSSSCSRRSPSRPLTRVHGRGARQQRGRGRANSALTGNRRGRLPTPIHVTTCCRQRSRRARLPIRSVLSLPSDTRPARAGVGHMPVLARGWQQDVARPANRSRYQRTTRPGCVRTFDERCGAWMRRT